MDSYVFDWLNLLVRWLHIITGIAWIGASFYFVWLDNHLVPPRDPKDASERGVYGEIWSVHGGGFYHAQKFMLGPKGEPLSNDLHWFKWEAYWTWISGMGMLAVVYWYGANAFLIDRSVMDLSVPAAIAISAGSLVAGWFIYDILCKTIASERVLGIVLFVLLTAAAWGYSQVFGGRAAYIHVGALIGTIMVWNVFFHVIPGQRKMVEAIRAGRTPEARPGIVGKQRSVHNTYFTLPVLFMMTSNHYPLTYGHKHAWLILAVIALAGVLIREFFVRRHKGRESWGLPAAAVVILLALAFVLAPRSTGSGAAGDATFAKVEPIIHERCAACHADKPTFAGFEQAPAGVKLDTPERIRAAAPRIQQQSVTTQAMPIGNLTKMTPEERALVGKWIAGGAKLD